MNTVAVNAAPRMGIGYEVDMRWAWIAFLLLFAIFFLGEGYDLFYSSGKGRDLAAGAARMGSSDIGSARRAVAFSLLAGLGVLFWFYRPGRNRFHVEGWLPFLILGFLSLAALSATWALEQNIVVKRVALLAFICVGAIGVASRFSNRDIARFAFAMGFLVAALGLVMEVALGSFQPWLSTYRFSGIMHPNSIGGVLGIFVLASLALARMTSSRRRRFIGMALFGFVLLVLTKSRTSLAAAVAALWVWWFLGSQHRIRFVALSVLAAALIGPVVIAVLEERIVDAVREAVLLGRTSGSAETFTGRIPLWHMLISWYVEERPFFGYGFSGFWTPRHIIEITAEQNWTYINHSHSGYMDTVLELGLVGLTLLVLLLVAGIGRAYRYYKESLDPAWLFMMAVLVWAAVGSIAEPFLQESTIRGFICFVILAKLAFVPPPWLRQLRPAFA